MSFGNIILNFGDSLVRQSEIDILKSEQWLNDAIIEFYFEYLGNQSAELNHDHIKFYGPNVTQLIKLLPGEEVQAVLGEVPDSIKYMFWPVNDSSSAEETGISGSHWSLLVFSRPDNRFLHFDSAGMEYNDPAARKLYQKLSPFIASTSTFHHFAECRAQANGRDCGLHVLKNACLIKDFVISEGATNSILWKNSQLTTATPAQAEKLRGELFKLIYELKQIVDVAEK